MFLNLTRFPGKKIVVSFFSFVIILSITSGCKQEKPANPEEGRKNVNGTELYYKTIGEGEPIVVLHGGPGFEHTYLLPGMAKLSDKHKLIFYDQRGSGRSLEITDSSSITIDNFVEDLEGIRKSFGLNKMNILGHSWGGLLGMLYAIKYPQNLNSLMLINTAPARSDFWDEFDVNMNRNRSYEDSIEIATLKTSDDYKNIKTETLEKYFKLFFKAYFYNQNLADSLNFKFTQRTFKDRFMIYRLYDYLRKFNILDQLSVIQCPTLIIHGDADPIPVSYIEELQQNISNSHLFVIKQCGHFPYVEKPDEFSRLIYDFSNGILKE
jgi:proline iminopeptidase